MSKARAPLAKAVAARISPDASLEMLRMGIVWSCAAALALAGMRWTF